MARWFTSDLHFGHRNIIKYSGRPWERYVGTDYETGEAIYEPDVPAMNEGLVERFNAMVYPEDEVYIMGDVALSFRYVEEFVPRLNGTKVLVAGNHDHCWDGLPEKKRKKTANDYVQAGFASVITSGVLPNFMLKNDQRVTLSHLPYQGDHDDEHQRYASQRPKDRGQINICGHVHEKWTISGRSINVGVDRWDWYPVDEDTLITWVEALTSGNVVPD